MSKIKSVKYIGEKQTYDLELEHPDHQFYLTNGALTSNSHAIAYAITTYQCAWLLTYYPEEWVTSNIDYSTVGKGKVNGKEDPKAVAIREAQKLGFKIKKADINFSSFGFESKDYELYPGFASLKYTGETVLEEINKFRPYEKLEDLLINPDGSWRHSKFNKRALGTLIQLNAFESMDLVGEGKQFKNYKHLYTVLVENYDDLKKKSKRKKDNDIRPMLQELIKTHENVEDWTQAEKIEIFKTLAGSMDINLIISAEKQNGLEDMGYNSMDHCVGKESKNWAVVLGATLAKTRGGMDYVKLRLMSDSNAEYNCSVWNFKGRIEEFKTYSVVAGKFSVRDNFISCQANNLSLVDT